MHKKVGFSSVVQRCQHYFLLLAKSRHSNEVYLGSPGIESILFTSLSIDLVRRPWDTRAEALNVGYCDSAGSKFIGQVSLNGSRASDIVTSIGFSRNQQHIAEWT